MYSFNLQNVFYSPLEKRIRHTEYTLKFTFYPHFIYNNLLKLYPRIYLLSVVTTDDVLTRDAGIPKDFPTCDVITLDGKDSTAVRAGRTKRLESTNQYRCNRHWQSCLIVVDNLVEYF